MWNERLPKAEDNRNKHIPQYSVDALPEFRSLSFRNAWWAASEFEQVIALGPLHYISDFSKIGVST